MDGGAWSATVHGVSKSRTRLSDFTFFSGNTQHKSHCFLPQIQEKKKKICISSEACLTPLYLIHNKNDAAMNICLFEF